MLNLEIPGIYHTRNIKGTMISPLNLIYWLSVVLNELSYIEELYYFLINIKIFPYKATTSTSIMYILNCELQIHSHLNSGKAEMNV